MMNKESAGILVVVAVAALAACAGNPMPGDSGYPYNVTGTYDTSFETMGTVYEGPAEIATSPGGMIYGSIQLEGAEAVLGDLSGTISGDTLTFESNYERAGGCVGVLAGSGVVAEGGGSVEGDAVVDDACVGEMFDAVFTMTRKAQ